MYNSKNNRYGQAYSDAKFATLLSVFELIFVCSVVWWSVGDSNPGPPACKAGALAN